MARNLTAWQLAGKLNSVATSMQPRRPTDGACTAFCAEPAQMLPQKRLRVVVRRGGGRHARGTCGVVHDTQSHRMKACGEAELSRNKRTFTSSHWLRVRRPPARSH